MTPLLQVPLLYQGVVTILQVLLLYQGVVTILQVPLLYQGVVTPIITIIFRAETCTLPTYIWPTYFPYSTKKSQGHRQLSSVVTQSQAVVGQSQIVTLVAALSTVHIGVTTFVCVDEKQIIASPKKNSLLITSTGVLALKDTALDSPSCYIP